LYAKKENNGDFSFYGEALKKLPSGNLQGVTDKNKTHLKNKAKIFFRPFMEAPEQPDEEYPFWLTNYRFVGHFHTGTMSHRSKSLKKRWPEEYVEINENDAKRLGIKDGDLVKVETRRATLVLKAKVTPHIREGVVAIPWHWNVNYLTTDVLDEYAKMPELKTAACRISKVEG